MSDEIVKRVLIDPNREDYRAFFTTQQAQSLHERRLGALQSIVDDLGFAWRSAAYAAGLPGQVAGQIPGFLKGEQSSPSSPSAKQSVTEMVLGLLVSRLSTITADPSFLNELRSTIIGLVDEVAEVRAATPIAITEDDVWEQYLEEPEFQFYVLSSQRFCFLSVVAAYEAFLLSAVHTVLRDDSIRVDDRKPTFYDRLRDALGEPIASLAWGNRDVPRSREIRNSIMHARGRVTPKLESYRNDLRIFDGEIQLFPEDNRNLFASLVQRVNRVLDHVARKPLV